MVHTARLNFEFVLIFKTGKESQGDHIDLNAHKMFIELIKK